MTRTHRPAGRFPGRGAVCLRAAGFLAAAAALLASSTCSPHGAWDLLAMRALALFPQYGRVMSLTLDNTGQNEDLADFPLLVTLTPERFQYAAAAPGGSDLRFVSADGDATLPHEIEQWNQSGTSWVWVQVARVPGAGTLEIELLYDGPEGGVPEAPAELWKDYELVYHLHGYPVSDSSPNGNHGAPSATPTLVAGKVGPGFPTSDSPKQYIDTGYGLGPGQNLTAGWTVEAWVYGNADPHDTGDPNLSSGPVMGDRNYNLGWDHDDPSLLNSVHCADATKYRGAKLGNLGGGSWHYVVGVYDGEVPLLSAYANGNLVTANPDVEYPLLDKVATTHIGTSENHNLVLDGIVDEVRISAKVRSADWLRAQYLSMTDAFITYGPTLTR